MTFRHTIHLHIHQMDCISERGFSSLSREACFLTWVPLLKFNPQLFWWWCRWVFRFITLLFCFTVTFKPRWVFWPGRFFACPWGKKFKIVCARSMTISTFAFTIRKQVSRFPACNEIFLRRCLIYCSMTQQAVAGVAKVRLSVLHFWVARDALRVVSSITIWSCLPMRRLPLFGWLRWKFWIS